ncbi:MAG: hypothetical protein AAF636_01590 [Pseudomonadota bacterium]
MLRQCSRQLALPARIGAVTGGAFGGEYLHAGRGIRACDFVLGRTGDKAKPDQAKRTDFTPMERTDIKIDP